MEWGQYGVQATLLTSFPQTSWQAPAEEAAARLPIYKMVILKKKYHLA